MDLLEVSSDKRQMRFEYFSHGFFLSQECLAKVLLIRTGGIRFQWNWRITPNPDFFTIEHCDTFVASISSLDLLLMYSLTPCCCNILCCCLESLHATNVWSLKPSFLSAAVRVQELFLHGSFAILALFWRLFHRLFHFTFNWPFVCVFDSDTLYKTHHFCFCCHSIFVEV